MSKYTYDELKEELKHRSVDSVAKEITEYKGKELTDFEQLALITAMAKALKAKSDEIRKRVDNEMLSAYMVDGTDRKTLRIGKTPVGTISVKKSKDTYWVGDRYAFNTYIKDNGCGAVHYEVDPYQSEVLRRKLIEEGIEWEQYFTLEAEPSKDFIKRLTPSGDVMVDTGTGEIVPGIHPKEDTACGTIVRDCKPEVVLPLALSISNSTINNLLVGEVEND